MTKMYYDTEDPYYSSNHESQISKSKPKDNDATIGKISLILIIMCIAFLISGWLK